ncbi:hypothetical protein TWF506_006168 [Arthrobotrys conoides]|uniref:Uncharacterized protein n=1 Tax=Arthrobotrys conoides TaxID=74498 RepID=A0AAN8RYK6_9PEZI
MATTPNDEEIARRRFLTECQILSSIDSEKSQNLRRTRLEGLRQFSPSVWDNDIADNHELNSLLDNFAFLLVQNGGGDCISVALVGFTRDKIKLVAQTSDVSGSSDYRSEDRRQRVESIRQHGQKLFDLVKEYSLLAPEDSRDFEIFMELLKLQIKYSSGKLHSRTLQLTRFIEKVEGFELPTDVSLGVGDFWARDEFSIHPVPNLGREVHTELYEKFSRQNSSVGLPPLEEMLVLNRRNFDSWTKILLWVLAAVRKEVGNLCSEGLKDEGGQILTVIDHLNTMEGLVTKSQLFRTWVEVTTRTIGKEKKRLEERKEEDENGEARVEGLGVNLGSGVRTSIPSVPEQNHTGSVLRSQHEILAQKDSSPRAQGASKHGALVDTIELSSVLNPKLKRMGWIKTTLKRVVPKTIVNRLMSKARRSKESPKHVRDIFAASSHNPPGGGDKNPDSINIATGEQKDIEAPEVQPKGGQSDVGRRNLVGVGLTATSLERGPAQEGYKEEDKEEQEQEQQQEDKEDNEEEREEEEGGEREGEQEEEEGEEEQEAQTVTATNQSTDFNILWLIPQHMIAIKSILDSDRVQKSMRTRDFDLQILEYDEEAEPTSLPCEPLRETLACLLTVTNPLDTDKYQAVTRFSDHAETYRKETSGSKWLKTLDIATPTVKVSGHAELLLLSYIQQRERTSQYPYPYIGMSKPPCLVCEIIFLRQHYLPIRTQKGHTHVQSRK